MFFNGKTRGGKTHAGQSEETPKRRASLPVFCGSYIHDGWSEGLPDPSTPGMCGNCSRTMKKRGLQPSSPNSASQLSDSSRVLVSAEHHTVPVGKRRRLRGADLAGAAI